MAQAIQTRESEWAKSLSEVERDPLFFELFGARQGGEKIIRFKRFGRTGISTQFYEMQDANVQGGGDVSPELLLEKKKGMLELIQKMGQGNFEKYFLYREESEKPDVLSEKCGLTAAEVKKVQDFILDMSVEAEFYHPSLLQPGTIVRPTLVGKIIENNDASYSISYFSPHLARGLYEINHTALKWWQKQKGLSREDAAKLRRYIGLLELSNLKQGAFWRVIDFLLTAQKDYFITRDLKKMAPVSLREVARQLDFAASTISRVIHAKSVQLPWDKEVPIAFLMPGQRKIVLSILESYLEKGSIKTDAQLGREIANSYGIKVSRRTITACRHVLKLDKTQRKAA